MRPPLVLVGNKRAPHQETFVADSWLFSPLLASSSRCYLCFESISNIVPTAKLPQNLEGLAAPTSAMPSVPKMRPAPSLSPYMLVLTLFVATVSQTSQALEDDISFVPNVMTDLLGGEDNVADFFESHFEYKPFHVDDSARHNRKAWMKSYRRFVRDEDVDALILKNSSAINPLGPLQIGHDIDLLRIADVGGGVWGRQRLASLFSPQEPPNLSVELAKVHTAFKEDGFEFVMHRMESRSVAVRSYVDRLRDFWMVDASARLCFIPSNTAKVPRRAPVYFADDIFIVQLDGELTVHLYKDHFPYPSRHHETDFQARQSAYIALGKRHPKHEEPLDIKLDEGDTLYVPRGFGMDARTNVQISLHMIFAVATHSMTIKDGILAALNSIPGEDAYGQTTPLDSALSEDENEAGGKSTWLDLLQTAVHVASEFTPDLRRFLHVGSAVGSAVEDIGGLSAPKIIEEQVRRFSKAAQEAMFEPMLELLEEDDPNLIHVATEDVIAWARQLAAAAKSKTEGLRRRIQAEKMFQHCMQSVQKSQTDGSNVFTQIVLDHYKREHAEFESRVRRQEISLTRHGEKFDSVLNETSLSTMAMDGEDPKCNIPFYEQNL